MKKRDFYAYLKTVTTAGRLDVAKIKKSAAKVRRQVVEYLVRHRAAIVVELIPASVDRSWLSACGYLHQTTGAKSGFTFLHTAENKVQ